jgi:hypothetical protein
MFAVNGLPKAATTPTSPARAAPQCNPARPPPLPSLFQVTRQPSLDLAFLSLRLDFNSYYESLSPSPPFLPPLKPPSAPLTLLPPSYR